MKTLDQIFDESWESFSDVLLDVTSEGRYSGPDLKRIFLCLPENIQDTAYCYGLNDSPFKDDAYEWLRDHKNEWDHSV